MKSLKFLSFVLLSIGLIFIACQQFSPVEPVFDERGQTGALSKISGNQNRYIVVFDRDVVNEAAKKQIVDNAGGQLFKGLPIVNGAAIYLPAPAVEALSRVKGVIRIEEDQIMSIFAYQGKGKPTKPDKPDKPGKPGGPGEEPPPPQEIPWGIDRIDADLAWETSTGTGVKVGILDTGIDPGHSDLSVIGGYNAINSRKSYKDDNGHGTHVAGTVAALDNDIGVVGVGPSISLWAVKALDRKGDGWVSDIIDGIDWCVSNNVQVINMSFSGSSDVQSLHDAIIVAYGAGVTMVAAAGNDGGAVNYPAVYTETIAVSASDESNNIAVFSSRGTEIDLIAPGVNINSTYLESSYKILDGTSMAAPHVTSTAALVLQLNPGLTPDGVKSKLKSTAENIGLSSDLQGAGLVDAEGSVK